MKLKYKFTFLQKFLSYFISIKIEKSIIPYYLELILDRNTLVLNSKNANQSNQNLKAAFNQLFHRHNIYNKSYNNVLIFGLGLGSVVDLLTENTKVINFTAYENNSQILTWIEQYYDLENLKIVNDSAENFNSTSEKYDLIIVDLFQDEVMPKFLSKMEYWDILKLSLNQSGTIIWNTLKNADLNIEFESKKVFKTIDTSTSENRFLID